ncbi:response regulator transcription factor [Aromatoleum petrolei]|uniref:Response regulator n=1 Tax=Aromatoleum petrolei TaxID=76116 RepID=A0ABX1MJT5_9RHOO|nr:response regulator [Aromatoleum petrolei]NMF88217.1 response regulator [Aromatoleum petrolei]QTQ38923.1 Putative two component system response regulator [Aromatoleum petrolei]
MFMEQTVFIVDDDEFVRNAARRAFRSAGFEVDTFDGAESFLGAYEARDEACLVLDLRMPRMGGLELLERMKQCGIDLPVIIYTGNADVPVTVRAMQAGAFAVVEKPFSDELLIEHVRAAIAANRTQRARRTQIINAQKRLNQLIERERQIAKCLADGLTTQSVADRFTISPRTVEAHRANLFRKLEIGSSAVLAQMVLLSELG